MSDEMMFGIAKMPYEMAMGDEMSRRQFYANTQRLAAALEAARVDAARYRWLRKGESDDVAVVRGLGSMDYGMDAVVYTFSEELDGDDLDAAIDAHLVGADLSRGDRAMTDVDFFSPGARLALELECLLMDTRNDAAQSRWWDSAHEALEQWRQAVLAMEASIDAMLKAREGEQ